jgi:secreted PhoX family phosphatase
MRLPHNRASRSLPLLPPTHGGRSAMTCIYRCGNACAHEAPNTSGNEYFGDVLAAVASRRGILRAGAVIALAAAGAPLVTQSADAGPADGPGPLCDCEGHEEIGTRFTPVAPNRLDQVTIPPGFQQRVLIRWGDPVVPGAPAFNPLTQNPTAQAMQFGFNNDFCGLVELSEHRWLMVSNHEYSNEFFMWFNLDPANLTEQITQVSWATHGMSVVVVEPHPGGGLRTVLDSTYNRRITATTPIDLRGPAAGSPYLRTTADPSGTLVLGTLNNCAGGVTPWGTVLSGEENTETYFANANAVTDPVARARLARYAYPGGATIRRWELFDNRFDLAVQPNEANRFGYIVEIDPLAPGERPVKHTALGRFKHEGATIQVANDHRVVAYMGDDERFEYIYKFVSDAQMMSGSTQRARDHNKRLLDAGTLYVARFTGDSPPAQIDGTGRLPADGEFDGTGTWIPLARNNTSFVPGFTATEVYVFTRLAADAAGATKMDRPEDIEISPRTGIVFASLSNNSNRGAAGLPGPDEANPRSANRHGHVLELMETAGNHSGTTFSWRLLLVCGDPAAPDTYYAGYPKSQVSPISCPDNLTFDKHGNLWIATDSNALGFNDGLFVVPVLGTYRGRTKQFLTAPIGAEVCGPIIADDFVLVSVQHPGEVSGFNADNPASHWPDGGTSLARPSVVVVWPAPA